MSTLGFELLPVELVENMVQNMAYEHYRSWRAVSKSIKFFIDSKVKTEPRVIFKRYGVKLNTCIEKWVTGVNSLLENIRTADSSDPMSENEWLEKETLWDGLVGQLDHMAIEFTRNIMQLYQETLRHLTHLGYNVIMRLKLRVLLRTILETFERYEPKMISEKCLDISKHSKFGWNTFMHCAFLGAYVDQLLKPEEYATLAYMYVDVKKMKLSRNWRQQPA
jgi:hypothetical protein